MIKKYKKLFASLSIFSACAPYSNVIQAAENVKKIDKSKKLSINLLNEILEFDKLKDYEQNGLICSEILRLRRNMGIPSMFLKINVEDLPITYQYVVIKTINSLLQNEPEFKKLIQNAFLTKNYHRFAILGACIDKKENKVIDILKKYLSQWTIERPNRKELETISEDSLGECIGSKDCTTLLICNHCEQSKKHQIEHMQNDLMISLLLHNYCNGGHLSDEFTNTLKNNKLNYGKNCEDNILYILYLIFTVIHEFGHLLHECKCVTFKPLGLCSKNFSTDVKFTDYIFGQKFEDLFPTSKSAKKIFECIKNKNYGKKLFTTYGINAFHDQKSYHEMWADSFALRYHPFTDENELRDQFVDDFFHLDNQYDINKFNRLKAEKAKELKNWNYLIKSEARNWMLEAALKVEITKDFIDNHKLPESFMNEMKFIQDYEKSNTFSDEDISYFESTE